MKKLLTLFFILTVTLFSNELITKESSAFGTKVESSIPSKTSYGKNLYLSYIKYPNHVYKNQRFEVVVKALVTRGNFNYIQTKFIGGKNIKPLNKKEKWLKSSTSKNEYTNRFYFKAKEKDFVMPKIEVRLYNNKNLVERRVLSAQDISFSDIAKNDERFTNVIAEDLQVIGSKTKQYSNKEALTVIDLKGKYSNLEDFNLKAFEDQGITSMDDKFPNQHMIYNVTIPIHQKSIIFNYYNTSKNSFEKITLPIVFNEELVSTQTDLNPNNSSFEFYKKVAMGVLTLILLILFIWKRNYLILIPFVISLAIFAIFAMPNKTIKLKKDTVIYILPTKNSTIFQKVVKESTVEEMKRKNGFIKIMFGAGNYIGWVKEKDVSKN